MMAKYDFKGFKSDQTLYEILGVASTSSHMGIRAAYYRQDITHHPELKLAFKILDDRAKRSEYDAYLASCSEEKKAPSPRSVREDSLSPVSASSSSIKSSDSSHESDLKPDKDEAAAVAKPKTRGKGEDLFFTRQASIHSFIFINEVEKAKDYLAKLGTKSPSHSHYVFHLDSKSLRDLESEIQRLARLQSYGEEKPKVLVDAKGEQLAVNTSHPAVMLQILKTLFQNFASLKYCGAVTSNRLHAAMILEISQIYRPEKGRMKP